MEQVKERVSVPAASRLDPPDRIEQKIEVLLRALHLTIGAIPGTESDLRQERLGRRSKRTCAKFAARAVDRPDEALCRTTRPRGQRVHARSIP